MSKIKREFANLPIVLAMKAVRCGWELETQAVNGQTHGPDEDADPDFDEDGYRDAVDSVYTDLITCDELPRIFAEGSQRIGPVLIGSRGVAKLAALAAHIPEDMIAPNSDDEYPSLSLEGLRAKLNTDGRHAYDRFDEHLRDIAEECVDRAEYISYPEGIDPADVEVPRGVEAKTDSSVNGLEFIIAGNGCSANDFGARLKKLLDMHDLTIDTGCSFHIHLSVPGIEHQYGAKFQGYLIEYLLSQFHRVPARVQKRWRADTNYFRPEVTHDKYRFVHFHNDLGTWEFRCFGNVNSWRDGMKCLQLAVEALQYAYRIQLGMAESVDSGIGVRDWTDDVYSKVVGRNGNSEALTAVVRKKRLESQAA